MPPVELDVKVHADGLEFRKYPFPCAGVRQRKRVAAADITECVENFVPMALRVGDELLFVPHAVKDDVLRFCENHQVLLTKRVDLWDMLLEPFLDTEFTPQTEAACYRGLARYGIDKELCDALRQSVAKRMEAYNFLLWEWVHLGLYDVLLASRGVLSGFRLGSARFAAFYDLAMQIALKSFV